MYRVVDNKVVRPDGSEGAYEVVETKPFVVVIPFVENKFFMFEQYHPVKDFSLEFPMGNIEEGETFIEAALRELREETGLLADTAEYLGYFWSSNGFSDQVFHVCLVQNASFGNQDLEDTEVGAEIKMLSRSELEKALTDNHIKDSPTITAYCIYNQKIQAP